MALDVSPRPHAEPLPNLPKRAAAELFGDIRFRPSPHTMASLILDGLTETTIVAAGRNKGFRRPAMDDTLEDLDASLPYYQQMSDVLADEHSDDVLLFAGRDAEALYDDFAIAHTDKAGHLLPASSRLWGGSSTMTTKPSMAEPFLGQYDLTRTAVVRRRNRYALVDSGFYGSIGKRLDEQVDRLYGISLRRTGALSVRLAAAETDAIGTSIIDLPNSHARPCLRRFERMHGRGSNYSGGIPGNTYGLAVNMQIMPRYHGQYLTLSTIKDSRVVALPDDRDPITDDVDGAGWSINSSVVNPVAAAITQFRVVRAALIRSGSGSVPYIEASPRGSLSRPEQEGGMIGLVAKLGRIALGR